MKTDIKQFKLTNNEEIICEVVEWNTGEDMMEILVNKALRVIALEDYQKGFRFFAFRPWMSFSDDPNTLQSVNASHIIVTTNPSPDILKHYKACVRALTYDLKNAKNTKTKKKYANLDEIQHAIARMSDDEMDIFLEEKYGAMAEDNYPQDSDKGNVIKFKPRNKTYH
tara:strand:- start:1648 stop:2151 length:504 start_codon:yes stop_codon:yes gene_type:complete